MKLVQIKFSPFSKILLNQNVFTRSRRESMPASQRYEQWIFIFVPRLNDHIVNLIDKATFQLKTAQQPNPWYY